MLLVPLTLVTTFLVTTFATAQYAFEIVDFESGVGSNAGYDDPEAVLGEPTRMSSLAGIPMSVVTPFQPAWNAGELLTIGAGGHLVIAFEELVHDDQGNPFGIDLLIFGNAFFLNSNSKSPCVSGLYDEGGVIEVSLDGIEFVAIESVSADGIFPTLGYLDAEPFGVVPGTFESDFTRPVEPGLGEEMLSGMCWEDMLLAYDGSGGGTPIDLAGTGLPAIRFVRITVSEDAMFLPEIDALADVASVRTPDLNGDGVVNGSDLTILLAAWGSVSSPADLDGDGIVGGADLTILLAAWS